MSAPQRPRHRQRVSGLMCAALWGSVGACHWAGDKPPDGAAAPPVVETRRVGKPAARPVPASYKSWGSAHFRVFAPQQAGDDAAEVLQILEMARLALAQKIDGTGFSLDAGPGVEVIIYATTGDFTTATGRPWWTAAATDGATIEMQPCQTLRARQALTTTLRHEYVHAVLASVGRGTLPRWLNEGLALHFAGEGAALPVSAQTPQPTRDELENILRAPATPEALRAGYAAAYRETQTLMQTQGESRIWRLALAGQYPQQ